eukprot:scaffold317434_cov30-Prasinocladus_malaysianus.AAC.2
MPRCIRSPLGNDLQATPHSPTAKTIFACAAAGFHFELFTEFYSGMALRLAITSKLRQIAKLLYFTADICFHVA